MVNQNSIEEFVEAVKQEPVEKNNTYSAEVSRVEKDGTVWVHVAGSQTETPVSATASEVKKGDYVNVEWRNNKLYVVGNSSNPAVGTSTAKQLRESANEAMTNASMARAAADSAKADAELARGYATEAKETTDEINAYAETAGKTVTQILDDGETAGAAAKTAVTNLAQVQAVLEVAEWIATHGVYTHTTDVVINPNKTYYTVVGTEVTTSKEEDFNTYYVLNGTIYVKATGTYDPQETYYLVSGTPVTNPVVESIETYYELNVSDAMSNYIQSHLMLNNDGLYVMADDSEWKVLVADDGVYIVDPNDDIVAKYKSDITIGIDDGTQAYIYGDYHSLQMFDKENAITREQPFFWVSDLRGIDGTYELLETFIATQGGQTTYICMFSIVEIVEVLVNGAALSPNDYQIDPSIPTHKNIKFTPAITGGSSVEVKYKSSSDQLKAFTFGNRDASANVGACSMAVGKDLEASGNYSFSHGENCDATGYCSVAHGYETTSSGVHSHAEGFMTTSSGNYSHAEGRGTSATGQASHAEGYKTTASGQRSHAEGMYTIAEYDEQLVIGIHNDNKPDNLFEVGNGNGVNSKSNAFEVARNGNVKASGKILSKSRRVGTPLTQTVTSSETSIGSSSYVDITKAFSAGDTYAGLIPMIRGYNISGSGTSYVANLGCYISGDETNGYVAHCKCRNNGTSAAPTTATWYIVWI